MTKQTPAIKSRKITDYQPDPANPNAHSERGVGVLSDSIASVGLGRSIVVDKNGIVLAGNSTQERAVDQGFEDAIEVESDGTKLIVVKRTDLDLMDDPENRARKLTYFDNYSALKGVVFDPEQVQIDLDAGIDLDKLFGKFDLDMILGSLPGSDDWNNALGGLADGDRAPFQQMTFTLHDEQAEIVKRALDTAKDIGAFADTGNENSNGNALARVCELFLGDHG